MCYHNALIAQDAALMSARGALMPARGALMPARGALVFPKNIVSEALAKVRGGPRAKM